MQSKEEKKINQASIELIEKEKIFGSRVQILVNFFEAERELIEQDPILTKTNALIKHFAEISPQLVDNFREILIDSNPEKKSSDLINAFFDTYSKYTLLFNEYLDAINNDSERFEIVSVKFDRSPEKGNNCFKNLVIEPIQRGPRYVMSLQAILDLNATLPQGNEAKLTDLQIELIGELIKLSMDRLSAVDSAQPALAAPKTSSRTPVAQEEKKGIGYLGTSFGTGAHRASIKNWWSGTTAEETPATCQNETPNKSELSEESFTVIDRSDQDDQNKQNNQKEKHSRWSFGKGEHRKRLANRIWGQSSKSDSDKKDESQDLPIKPLPSF